MGFLQANKGATLILDKYIQIHTKGIQVVLQLKKIATSVISIRTIFMTSFRDRLNAHLPILLKLLSTTSLIVIALSTLCGSQSLKKLAGGRQVKGSVHIHRGNIMNKSHVHRNHKNP